MPCFLKIAFNKSERVLVIGESEKAKKLYQDLSNSKWTGSAPLGLFSFAQRGKQSEFCGDMSDVIKTVRTTAVNKVYIVIDKSNIKQVEELLEILADTTCSTIIVPELFSYNLLYSRVEDINGTPIYSLFDTDYLLIPC